MKTYEGVCSSTHGEHTSNISITFDIAHPETIEIFISVTLTMYVLELCLLFL